MEIYNSIDEYSKTKYESAIALGFFDGVHIAHKKVIENITNTKDNLKSAVFTFRNSPVLSFCKAISLLTDNSKKAEILENLGIDCLILQNFEDIKDLNPSSFVKDVLHNKLHAKTVSCGANYTFAKNAEGNTNSLNELCKEQNINCIVTAPVIYQNEFVSSTRIRKLINDGNIKLANTLLGYNFELCGKTIKGYQNGHAFGFPTINIPLNPEIVIPKFGVYKSEITINNKRYISITNIGVHPTVKESDPVCETHILNNGNIKINLSEPVSVSLIDFIRPEIKFESTDLLIEQIKKDIKKMSD